MTDSSKRPHTFFLSSVHLKLLATLSVAPIIMTNLGREFDLSKLEIKSWAVVMLLGTVVAAFVAGALSDALGRRRTGLFAAGLLFVASLISGFGGSYWIIIAMALVMGCLVSIIDVNMDGYIGSLSKGRSASGLFSRVQMTSDLMGAGLALVFGVLSVSVAGSWRWFFFAMAALNLVTFLFAFRDYPQGAVVEKPFQKFFAHLKSGLGLLRQRAFLCVVAVATFGSAATVALVVEGPVYLGFSLHANPWVYGGTFAVMILMGFFGYVLSIQLSRHCSPIVQLIVGSAIMLLTGIAMTAAFYLAPGHTILFAIPMAITFGGHTIVTGSTLAAATDIAQVDPTVGASMLTIFKRLISLLLGILFLVLTLSGVVEGGLVLSVSVLVCGAGALVSSILCILWRVDPVDS